MKNQKSDLEGVSGRINELHHEAQMQAGAAKTAMSRAVFAAWEAGKLLQETKKRCTKGTWSTWLETQFDGSARTAQRYMALARKMQNSEELKSLSLRQAYLHTGIAMAANSEGVSIAKIAIPKHVMLANKLIRLLRRRVRINEGMEDLRILYKELELVILKKK